VRAPLLLAGCQLVVATSLPAQQRPVQAVRWWEAAIVVGTIGVASVADRGVDGWIQDHRSPHSDNLARAFRNGGEPELVFGIPAALIIAGAVSRRPALARRGERVLASVIVAGLTTGAIKEVSGRLRPVDTTDPYVFRPLTNHDAFPSGHATVAFALATSLSEEIRRPWAAALLYAGATGTAWSRLNDQQHWLSDVLAGAAVGITAAKMMEGRWRVFGLGQPRFLMDPRGGARLEWRATF
jgi:membrane-associated phospholipid phosphatase